MSQPPTTDSEPHEAGKLSRSAVASIRIIMPVVLIGFATVLCSLFFLLWPAGPASRTAETTIHAARIFQQSQTEGATGLIRSLVDVSIYVVILAGIACLIMAVIGRRGAVLGLIGVGLLGLIYASGMALYNGPMVSVCGFTMILFGGVIAWVASGAADVEPPPSDAPVAEAIPKTDDNQEAATPQSDQESGVNSPHLDAVTPESTPPNSEDAPKDEVTDQPGMPNWVP